MPQVWTSKFLYSFKRDACQYHSTNSLLSYSFKYSSYQMGKKPGEDRELSKNHFFPETQECLVEILRCVFSVVLSNNKNKLLVHMYIVKNTTLCLIVRLL